MSSDSPATVADPVEQTRGPHNSTPAPKVRSGIKPDTIVAIWATVIALCALGVSFFDGYITRRHNRLSVTPHIAIMNYTSNEAENNGYVIESTGLGPAIIKRIVVTVKGREYDVTTAGAWHEILNQLNIDQPWVRWKTLTPGVYLQPGKEEVLLVVSRREVNGRTVDPLEIARFNLITRDIGVRVEYGSVYGEEFVILSTPARR